MPDRLRRARFLRAGLLVGLVALGSVLAMGRAAAQASAPLTLWVDSTLPPGCVDTFSRDLLLRAHHVHLAADARTRVRVNVESGPRGFRGTVELEEASGTTRRTLEAPTCAEVLDGLALVAALAVDPQADTAPRVQRAPPAPAGALAAGAGDASSEADASAGADAEVAVAPPAPVAPPQPDAGAAPPAESAVHPEAAAAAPRWSFALGGNVELAAVVPSTSASFGVFAEAASGAPGPLAPSFRVRGLLSLPSSVDAPGGGGRFHWALLALDACPVRFALASSLSLAPCAGIDLGAVFAEGEGTQVESNPRTRPWIALRALARASWRPLGWGAFELEAGPVVPLLREEFMLQPAPNVYRSPAVFAFGGASFLVRFR